MTDTEPFYSALIIHNDSSRDTAADFEVIKELTKDQYDIYSDAYHEIDVLLNRNIFTYMKKTMGDLIKAIKADMEEMTSGKLNHSQPDDIVRMGIRMRSAALAFCSALHYHQEHTYTELEKLYGENSDTEKEVRKILNRLNEKSSHYRLMYHLRNTMVHHSMEAVSIHGTAQLDKDGNTIAVSTPKIDVKAMTDLDKKMKEKYREQLTALPDQTPDLLQYAVEAFKAANEANDKLLLKMYPNMKQSCATILEFDELFEKRDGVRATTTERSTNEPPPLKFSYNAWASNVVQYARRMANRH
ncbi:hypothetical protein [Rhodococcus sp. 1168]|uniref:hypothetical protein n=1 Tax=Rhodococcus sp. 1168 TaxID=2018041 RepID=UPI000F736472|nr:hypothetical protein [Rhodococcus sp. 1168]